MTALHLIALVAALIGAVVACDLLAHRGVASWPVGILVVVLFVVAGWLYNPWLAAIALGAAVGTALMAGRDLLRTYLARKAARTRPRRHDGAERR